MTNTLPTWIVCEGCQRKGRAYQFPPDKAHPERRNRGLLCYECWHATLPVKVGDVVTVLPTVKGWSEMEIANYGNREAKIVGYSPSGGERGWEVEVYGGPRDGAHLWVTLDEMILHEED